MRHWLGAGATARYIAAALGVACGILLAVAGSAPTQAYPGAHAEAQFDPRSADPYSFPNIELCCKEHKKKKRRHWRRRNGDADGGRAYDDGDYERDYGRRGGRAVRVSCGAPRPYSYSSISEALEHVREDGRIVVRPGAPCDVSGLTIDQGVTIESDDREYGARAELRGDGCISVEPSYASSLVTFRSIDIDGCVAVENGRLNFDRVNLASRSDDDAVRLDGGTFSATESTIRARGIAINARRGVMVSLTGGGFASAARAEYTIRLETDGANLQDTLVKGGIVGVFVGLRGRYPVTFKSVHVIRRERHEIHQVEQGRAGVIVGGSESGDDLPSLPNLPGTTFSMEGGLISGYADGLTLGPGTRGEARGVNIERPRRGIIAEPGASVDLRENRIGQSKSVGIYLARGATGSASFNDISCDDGECVCYDDDCTSRRDRDFGHGAFRMTGTRCED